MIYDGVLYFNNSPVIIPSTETVVTKNVKKKSKKIGAKLFNINTSDYKKLTSNKRVETIQLFDKLDEKIFIASSSALSLLILANSFSIAGFRSRL